MSQATTSLLLDCRCELGEGILWCSRRRVLYWVDILVCALWRCDPASGHAQSWRVPEPLGCIGLGEDGRLLLGLAKGLYAADVEAALEQPALALQKLADVEADDPHTRINDGRADRHGGFVFGTKDEHPEGRGAGRYYQYTAQHGLRELRLPPAAIPNAICFDATGGRMYFTDSPTGMIRACDYDPSTAMVDAPRDFASVDVQGAEPDGAIVDAEDALWNAQWGAGRVVRYLSDGRIDRIIALPVSQPTCCVLAGDALYVTTARVGLAPDALARQPAAGGVFRVPVPAGLARADDRVVLP
ncbi:MAG: SMP-30/gluconolactonase/LRE family protein [Xanthomonadales bacterium]|nr:SMP-30/gluconolactonase/LRE family protein [Xanthomonadales bacterium]